MSQDSAIKSTTPTTTTTTQVSQAVEAAWLAALQLRDLPLATRVKGLRKVADALDANVDALVPVAESETHLGLPRLSGEVSRTSNQFRLFADAVEEGSFLEAIVDCGDAGATPPAPDVRRLLRPIGPVAVFGASNFPFAFSVAGGDTASALAAGCPVIAKAHPGHEQLSALVADVVAQALWEAGWPHGSIQLVFGEDAGRELVVAPRVAAVGFTGSLRGGTALMHLAQSRPVPIPFYGELGSLNPVIVTTTAAQERLDELGQGLAASFTLGAGQFCTKPGVVIYPAQSGLAEVVVAALDDTQVPMLNAHIATGFQRSLAQVSQHDHVNVLFGDAGQVGALASPVLLHTTAAQLVEGRSSLLVECFGPSTLLVAYENEDELLAVVDALEGSLTITVQGSDFDTDLLKRLLPSLEDRAGRLIWNGWPTGVAVNWAMQHGGPWPSATTAAHTSVGATAVRRFLRPVAFQDWPEQALPEGLRSVDGVPRRINGVIGSGG